MQDIAASKSKKQSASPRCLVKVLVSLVFVFAMVVPAANEQSASLAALPAVRWLCQSALPAFRDFYIYAFVGDCAFIHT